MPLNMFEQVELIWFLLPIVLVGSEPVVLCNSTL